MAPQYYFRIDEIEEQPSITPNYDSRGYWMPSTKQAANRTTGRGVSGRYWKCRGNDIVPVQGLPPGCYPYKTFSVYYSDGVGFWIYRGDTTQPDNEESWHTLKFDQEDGYSSYLTNAGEYSRLRTQRRDQAWPAMLLPSNYHIPPELFSQTAEYGGLVGELPIFLALMAFSVQDSQVDFVLGNCFTGGRWRIHSGAHGRRHKRGVVVYVWTCPTSTGLPNHSNHDELSAMEVGSLGKYYY